MKLNNFVAFLAVAGAGLVTANPIPEAEGELRVFDPSKMRLGHIAGRSENGPGPRVITVTTFTHSSSSSPNAAPCAGARFRQKSIELSNAFRQALGMPLIKVTVDGHGHGEARPVFIPLRVEHAQLHHGNEHEDRPRFHAHHHHNWQGHGHGRFHGHRDGSFVMRLHFALMSLGPWEGRAVAFVLGCGIGVLLRMIWVLVVVGYRAVKGPKEEEEQEDGYLRLNNVEVLDAEEIFVAPPQYFVDEKAPVEN